MKTPRGLLEDVIVKVHECYFPMNFLILDMASSQELKHTPIILGCPFLATAKANINCTIGMMDISFGGEKVSLNVFKASQYPDQEEECNVIDILEYVIDESLDDIKDTLEEGSVLQDSPFSFAPYSKVEPLHALQSKPVLLSLEHPLVLELKPLLDSLKYAYLGPDHTFPVIIASNLSSAQES